MVNNDLEELNAVNRKIDVNVTQIQEYENQRIYLKSQLEEAEDRTFENIAEMHKYFENEYSDQLFLEVKKLKELLGKVSYKNRINQGIIKSSREYIRSTMAIVTGYGGKKQDRKFATYGNQGKYSQTSKQARSFVNKEV